MMGRVLFRRLTPWLLAVDLVRQGHRHLTEYLTPGERKRLVELVRKSQGRWGNLAPDEQAEAKIILRRLDVPALAKTAAKTTVGIRKARAGR